ncbi:MAG: DoxX family protein [Hamadaea sp.]|nr:DoxX family protein [Hamadaea sp.]
MTTQTSANLIGVQSVEPKAGRARRFSMHRALWLLQVVGGVFFAGSGFGKVLLADDALYAAAPQAVAWYADVSQPLIVLIGVVEVLGGIGMILPAMTRVAPRLTPLASAGLALTMVFASAFHLVRGEYELMPATVVLGAVTGFVAVGRWRRRPIASAALTRSGAIKALAVMAAMILLVFAPTWVSMMRF